MNLITLLLNAYQMFELANEKLHIAYPVSCTHEEMNNEFPS